MGSKRMQLPMGAFLTPPRVRIIYGMYVNAFHRLSQCFNHLYLIQIFYRMGYDHLRY